MSDIAEYSSAAYALADADSKTSALARVLQNDLESPLTGEYNAIVDALTLKSLFFSEDWVYIVVDLCAAKISNQPLRVMRQYVVDGKVRVEPAEDHPLQQLLDNPNPLQDYATWMYALVVDLVLLGNSIQWRRKDRPSLMGIPGESVMLDFAGSGELTGYMAYQSGIFDTMPEARKVTKFDPKEIIHMRRPNPSSYLWGLSPFIPGQKSVLFNRYSGEYLNNFYVKGATPGLVLTMTQEANEVVALRTLKTFEEAHQGRRNQRRTMIMPKGVTASPVTHTLADQELALHLDKNRETILALLKVPKQEVGLATTGGLGSEEYKTAIKNFWASTLKPLMRIIAGSLELGFKDALGDRYFLEFDLGDVDALQEDKLAKANLATAMTRTRTLNEVREEVWEDPPVLGGDAMPGTAPAPAFPFAPGLPADPSVPPTASSTDPAAAAAEANQVTSPTQSLNGAQIASVVETLSEVAAGRLPRDSGLNLLRVALALSPADAESIMGSVGAGFTPTASDAPPPPADPVSNVPAPETASLEAEHAKRVGKVAAYIKSNADWYERREQTISAGMAKAEPAVYKRALSLFGDQAIMAVQLAREYLEDAKNYRAAYCKSDRVGRRSTKDAKLTNKAQLEKRLRGALKEFSRRAISPYVDALEATVELGYGTALDVPFNLPSRDEIDALRTRGKKQRRAVLEARGLRTFAQMDATTTEQIMLVIDSGVADGKSAGAIAKDIADNFRDVDRIGSRAEVIARTETLTAASIGQAAAMKDAAEVIPDLQKMWLNAGDDRVRGNPGGIYAKSKADHWSLQGEVVPHDAAFKNGLMYPRDTDGPANETIQCRCTWIMLPKDQMAAMGDGT